VKLFRILYAAGLIALAIAATLGLGVGNLLIRQDQAQQVARDRRLLTVICAHVVADEAYMRSIQAYNRQRIERQPSLAVQLHPLLIAIAAKQDAVVSLDHDDCTTTAH